MIFVQSFIIFIIVELVLGSYYTEELDRVIKLASTTQIRFQTSFGVLPNIEKNVRIECYNPTTTVFSTITGLQDPDISTKLDLNKKLALLIHGWNSTFDEKCVVEVFTVWTKYRDNNICRVDWSRYADNDYITASTKNTRLVGLYLTDFIKNIHLAHNFKYENVILVGHSLGAHVCGYIGQNCYSQIGLIIALDAAGPLFTFPYVIDKKYRLDETDAVLVQAIHTGDGVVGATIDIGKQDFRINTGFIPQRGCVYSDLPEATFSDPIRCSHLRAAQMFTYSLQHKNACRAVRCDNLFDYIIQQCSDTYDVMGLDSKGLPGTFYLATYESPSCPGLYYL